MRIVSKFRFIRFVIICVAIISIGSYSAYNYLNDEEVIDEKDNLLIVHEIEIDQQPISVAADSTDRVKAKENNVDNVDPRDIKLLSKLLYSEINFAYHNGKWELSTDKEMGYVGAVVMNRLNKGGWYGNTLREVIFKPGQFDGVNSSNWGKTTERTDRIAKEVLQGKYDINDDILYYFNPSLSTDKSFVQSKMDLIVFRAGGHVFTK